MPDVAGPVTMYHYIKKMSLEGGVKTINGTQIISRIFQNVFSGTLTKFEIVTTYSYWYDEI
jgi:hypothetical protein